MIASVLLACVSMFAAPVQGTVVVPYRQPACTYCGGHRGVVVAVREGSPVRAISDGTITFAGEVAGVTYVVLGFAPSLRLTYGYLRDRHNDSDVVVETGDLVRRGQVLGHSATRVYLGVRQGVEPRDPLRFLGARRARLVAPSAPKCGMAVRSR